MEYQFTASVTAQEREIFSIHGDDSQRLLIKLLCKLERMNSFASFVVTNNVTGETVHRGVKDSCV